MAINTITIAADNYNLEAGDESFFENAVDGTLATVGSAVNGAINSVGYIANAATNLLPGEDTEFESKDTYDFLKQVGADDSADFYEEHRSGIDAAGLLVGSLVPGMMGIKALQYASNSTKLLGPLGLRVSRLETLREEAKAAVTVKGTLYNAMHANTLKALASGFEVNFYESLAFETVALSTTIASPVYEDLSAGDMAWNTAVFGAFGGAVGGAFSAAKTFYDLGMAAKLIAAERVNPEKGTKLLKPANNIMLQKATGVDTQDDVIRWAGKDVGLQVPLIDMINRMDANAVNNLVGGSIEAKRIGMLKDVEEIVEHIDNPEIVSTIMKQETHQVLELSTGRVFPSSKGLAGNIADNAPTNAQIRFIPKLGEAVVSDEAGKVVRTISAAGKKLTDMTIEEAQVAYVSRAQLGLDDLAKVGNIQSTDVPALELLVQSGRTDIPIDGIAGYSADYAQTLLRDVKSEMLEELHKVQGKSPEIAAKILNLPEKANGKLYDVAMADMEKVVTNPRFAAITYDIKNIENDIAFTPYGRMAFAHAKVLAESNSLQRASASQAAWSLIGHSHVIDSCMPEYDLKEMLHTATNVSAASGKISFANADYNTMGSWAQNMGKMVNITALRMKESIAATLNPFYLKVKLNPELADEMIMVDSKMRLVDAKYVMLPDQAPNQLLRLDVALRMMGKRGGARDDVINVEKNPDSIKLSDDAFSIMLQDNRINVEKYRKPSSVLATSRGMWDVKVHEKYGKEGFTVIPVYTPPLNTVRYPHFYLVREADDVIGAGSHVSVIAAKSAEELAKKRAAFEATVLESEGAVGLQRYQFITKGDSKKYHTALNDYEYARGMNESRVDSTMRKAGILGEKQPILSKDDPRAIDEWVEDRLSFHNRMAARTVRDITENQYLEVFAQLDELGKGITELEASKTRNVTQAALEATANPYHEIIKTALDISNMPSWTGWARVNEFVEATGSKAFHAIRAASDDVFGMFSKQARLTEAELDAQFQKVADVAERVGLPSPYKRTAEYLLKDQIAGSPVLSRFISRGNGIVSMYALGVDAFQHINSAIGATVGQSAELTSVINAMNKKNVAVVGDLAYVKLPGSENSFFAAAKLTASAIKRYFAGGKVWMPPMDKFTEGAWVQLSGKELLDYYSQKGLVMTELQQYRSIVDNLAITGAEGSKEIESRMLNVVETVGETGRKLMGGNFVERFTRFIAADAMRQITDHAMEQGILKTSAHAETFWNTAVNRIQGNYIASQRPQVFQGAVGQAISLFMTYQVNLMQQLFRHVGSGDKKAAAMMMGVQGSIYGMQGLPGFNFINSKLIADAEGNHSHADLYTTVNDLASKDVADWVLYGAGSNALGLFSPELKFNLYTRGDINPRLMTILPAAIDETVLYKATVGFIGNIKNMAGNLSNGAPVSEVLYAGLQHQGINRPLAGLGAILAGGTYTRDGKLIAPVEEAQTFYSLSNAVRLMGSKPLDDAIAADALFRQRAYDAADKENMKKLAIAVRLEGADGSIDPEKWEDFAGEYVKRGGNPANFRGFIVDKLKDQQQGIVEQSARKMKGETFQHYMSIIGGDADGFEFARRQQDGEEE